MGARMGYRPYWIRLPYPPVFMRSGDGDRLGRARLSIDTGAGWARPGQAGYEQPAACSRSVAGRRPSHGASRCLWGAMVSTDEYNNWNRGQLTAAASLSMGVPDWIRLQNLLVLMRAREGIE